MIFSRALRPTLLTLFSGALVAASFGSQAIMTSVEDWPPSPLTDTILLATQDWHHAMSDLGLPRLHGWLRAQQHHLLGVS